MFYPAFPHSPAQLLLVLLLLTVLALPRLLPESALQTPPNCIANCSTLLKHSLGSIIGGYRAARTDLFAPLHSIIRSSANNVVVRRKSEWICLSIDKFKLCSDGCDDNKQKMVELANVGHWETICQLLFVSPKIFYDFISCQRRHLEEVQRRCRPLPQQQQEREQQQHNNNIKQFCRSMRDYTKCYSESRLKCSRNATEVFRQITDSISQSFAKIQQLSRGHLNIPDDCNVPILESVKAIIERGSQESEEAESGRADYWTMENREEEEERHGGNNGRGWAVGIGRIDFILLIFWAFYCWIKVP